MRRNPGHPRGKQSSHILSRGSARKNKNRGGTVLGKGRNNNVVFTFTDLPTFYPGCTLLKFYDDSHTEVLRISLEHMMKNDYAFFNSFVFKKVTSTFDKIIEIRNNSIIQRIFDETDSLEYTVLKKNYVVAVPLMNKSGLSPSLTLPNSSPHIDQHEEEDSLVLYKRMSGSLRDENVIAKMDYRDVNVVLAIGRSVLRFLVVLHEHGYIHMDIKPDNILVDDTHSDSRGIPVIALGDYGEVISMDEVQYNLQSSGSYRVGTFRYMSPILIKNDDENHVYPIFELMYTLEKATSSNAGTTTSTTLLTPTTPNTDAFRNRSSTESKRKSSLSLDHWEDIFDYVRQLVAINKQFTAKIDLHSLGLSLFHLMSGYIWIDNSTGQNFAGVLWAPPENVVPRVFLSPNQNSTASMKNTRNTPQKKIVLSKMGRFISKLLSVETGYTSNDDGGFWSAKDALTYIDTQF